MRIIEPRVEFVYPIDGMEIIKTIEKIGRVCYKSEDRITDDSAERFIRAIIKRGHESVLEHQIVTFRIICDRGISHEIVRHRLASYSQESTRYCNYSHDKFGGEITVIKPCFLDENTQGYRDWYLACQLAEQVYFRLLNWGCTPQEARDVLPASLKTEVVMTANLREWRHFLKSRTAPEAHPQMQQIAKMIYNELSAAMPVVFEDLKIEK